MRAAVLRKFGAPLVIEERPVPEPGPGQVVVALHRQGRTRVVSETRPLEAVNESIDEVLHGKARARIVLQP